MAKKNTGYNWHGYINEHVNQVAEKWQHFEFSESDEITQAHEEYQYQEEALRNKYEPYLKGSWLAVPDSDYPKIIIKEKTRKFPGSHKYPPYAFRLLCTVTGRQSKLIPLSDWPKYGILEIEGKTGGNYKTRFDIPDKLQPLKIEYADKRRAIFDKYTEKRYQLVSEGKHLDSDYYDYVYEMEQANQVWHERYSEYLQSFEWHEVRKRCLELDDFRCIITGEKSGLQAHHITYDNVGIEQKNDLITLNQKAHSSLHELKMTTRRVVELGCLNYRYHGQFTDIDFASYWFDDFGYRDSAFAYAYRQVISDIGHYTNVLNQLENRKANEQT